MKTFLRLALIGFPILLATVLFAPSPKARQVAGGGYRYITAEHGRA